MVFLVACGTNDTDDTPPFARFFAPDGITSWGNDIYVSDTYNHTIRKIWSSTGETRTIAGEAGSHGSTDGIGSAARFCYPQGITTDGSNIYVSDSSNHTIRKIVIETGEVTTIAGRAGSSGSIDGIGSDARFCYPQGITNDRSNLYVSDTSNNTIRKIVIATGEVTTIAGEANHIGSTDGIGSDARFGYIQGIAITNTGFNLYVSDASNHTIRNIWLPTGEVTTIAGEAGSSGSTDGNGSDARFGYPQGITIGGIDLYVSDASNSTIRKIDIVTGEVTTIAGKAGSNGSTDGTGSAARFYLPQGITGGSRSLYVSDSSNHTIRNIWLPTGEVKTLTGKAGSSGSTDGMGVWFN
ncbi:MAG: hypothetical protein GY754_25600 [bacterium]|nr:hypothetical protein [bacterium]